MKKIKDVFKLPVYVNKYGLNNAEHHTLIHDDAAESEKLEAIATAINHVDALAEALEEALSELDTFRSLAELDYNFSLFMENAKAALAAYRGEV